MKKFLLFAAAFAALSVSAQQDYTIEKVWGSTDVPAVSDTRQGVGLNGKFYINNKADQTIMVYGENGLANEQLPGGPNCGINVDQAGNLVVSLAAFPNAWPFAGDAPLVAAINPETLESNQILLSTYATFPGRLDYIGRAQGNLFADGEMYFPASVTGAKDEGGNNLTFTGEIARQVVTGGVISDDDSYLSMMDPIPGTDNMTCVHAVVDAEGNDALFYVYRGANPVKYGFDGDDLTGTTIVCPPTESGNVRCNQAGANFFAFDGKEFVIYPVAPTYSTYYDGFAVAEVGADVALFEKPATVTAAPNGFQTNFLNAEVVDENTVMLYQYTPGACMEVYKMTKVLTAVDNVTGAKTVTGVKYVNLAGQQSNVPFDGVNIAVTTYSDGTQRTVKVVK